MSRTRPLVNFSFVFMHLRMAWKDMHILFVCWGNICRSPAAEATFRKVVKNEGLQDKITIDSAGTISSHQGNPPDSRMTAAARNRNLTIQGSARKVNALDFEKADMLVTMDHFNFQNYQNSHPTQRLKTRSFLFVILCSNDAEVPDPYYGGASGFEKVLDLLEDGCVSLLEHIETELK